MKHKTAVLTGALLWAAVAKADGRNYRIGDDGRVRVSRRGGFDTCQGDWFPGGDADWLCAGPIIDRERISVISAADDGVLVPGWWRATNRFWFQGGIDGPEGSGPSPLVAAMRAFVRSKMGDEVELP